jgi:hypothetical protein
MTHTLDATSAAFAASSHVPATPPPGTRTLLACALTAGPLFLTVGIVQGLTRDGFDFTRIEEWKSLLRSSPLTKHGELVAWLKTEHGLGHGHANALVAYTLAEDHEK